MKGGQSAVNYTIWQSGTGKGGRSHVKKGMSKDSRVVSDLIDAFSRNFCSGSGIGSIR